MILGPQDETILDITVWHKFETQINELKVHLELHLKEEQGRGSKVDQEWPLFLFLTMCVLSGLNYNMFIATLILCELLFNGRTIFSIKVSGSMIWIIS